MGELEARWQQALAPLSAFLVRSSGIHLRDQELQDLLEGLETGRPRQELMALVKSFHWEPISSLLSPYPA